MQKKLKLIHILLPFFIFLFSSCESAKDKQLKLKIKQEKAHALQLAKEKALLTVKTTTVKNGHGMFQSLKSLSIKHKLSIQIINSLRDKVEFSKLKVGDQLEAIFDKNMELKTFTFSNSPAEKHFLNFDKETKKLNYHFHEEETVWSNRVLKGLLGKDSTLQDDLIETGLSRKVVARVINVLMCKVNFRLNARIGDQYKFLLKEKIYKGQILETKVLYMSYKGVRAGKSESYLYDDNRSKSIYNAHYTHSGEALIPSGLRYPVNSLHIRSGYGLRHHPVTGRRTMHRGVDLRARAGSPVYSVARGVVIESKFNKYAGNKIAIRHADRSVSYYLHLQKLIVKKGKRVKAHQIIGRVGSTGRVTGPHLHFGFKKPNGRWMNPMNKRMIATPKLKGERYVKLTKQIKETNSLLHNMEFLVASIDPKSL